MVLPNKKKEQVRKFLKDGETWEYIRNKTGVSNDAINKIRQEPLSTSHSTTPQADKNPKTIQNPTNQKQQPPTTKNTPDPHVIHLEQKINDVDHVQRTNGLQIQNVIKRLNKLEESHQTQEPPQEPYPEKPDDPRNLNELKRIEIQTDSPPSPTPDVPLIPKKNPDQTDAPIRK